MTSITARRPKLAIESVPIAWTNPPEVGHWWNAASIPTPQVESYLNRVVLEIDRRVGADNPRLRTEIRLFVKQETNHLRAHNAFNRRMYDNGLEELRAFEEKIGRDLNRLLEKRSLAFNAAYCAGFENFTMYTAKFFYERGLDLLDGADAAGSDFMLWHLAEEFEHRAVAHSAFRALSGNYFTRTYGLMFAFVHLNTLIGRTLAVIHAHDRAGMSPDERRVSVAREKAFKRRVSAYTLPRMAAILLPFYDPSAYRMPLPIRKALDTFGLAWA